MKGWRVAFRLAAREARRRKGRTLLVALLVALPVAGIVFGAAMVRTLSASPADEIRWAFGGADVRMYAQGSGAALRNSAEDVKRWLPGGSRSVVTHSAPAVFEDSEGRLQEIDLADLPLNDPLTAGVRVLQQGRAPANSGEIAVSLPVMRAAGAEMGDTLKLLRPNATLRITGVVAAPSGLAARVGIASSEVLAAHPEVMANVFVDLPDGVPLRGLTPSLRGVWWPELPHAAEDSRGHGVAVATLLGGLALVIAAIVASAALAIAARRQLRQLGILAASGASPDQLRGVMTAQGCLVGAVGSVIGVVAAFIGMAASAPFLDGWADHTTGGLELSLRDPLIALVLGVASATAAAWMPAFAASRTPVLSALAGRRPLGAVRRRVTVAGVLVAGAGLALMGVVAALPYGGDLWSFSLAGAVAVLLGATIASPAVIAALEPLPRLFRGSSRLALRSLVRQRTRAAAVIAAVMAAASMTMGGTTLLLSRNAREADPGYSGIGADVVSISGFAYDSGGAHRQSPVQALTDVQRILPGSVSAERRHAGTSFIDHGRPTWRVARLQLPASTVQQVFGPGAEQVQMPSFGLWEATESLPKALGVGSQDAAFARADVVLFAQHAASPGTAQIEYFTGESTARHAPVTAVVVKTSRRDRWGTALISPSRMKQLGLSSWGEDVLVLAPRPLSGAQRDALDRLSKELADNEERNRIGGTNAGSAYLTYVRPAPSTKGARAVFLGLSLVFTLGVIALGLALAAADGAGERALLGALGAPPASSRRIAVVQAVTLATLGGLLSIPVGFGPAATVLWSSDQPETVLFPAATALGLVVVVPAVVALLTAVGSRLFARRPPSAAALAAD